MNIVYYDSGTTNTRAYLFQNDVLTQHSFLFIGSKDCAIEGNNLRMLTMMKEAMEQLAARANLHIDEIDEIWMSGMVSSPTGILEISHLSTPVSVDYLRSHVVQHQEDIVFHRMLHIIPGVKTLPEEGEITSENFTVVNMMRGEETEIFGLLKEFPQLHTNSILIMTGSHTQIAFLHNGAITNILSTITGELYKAITENTILSTSLTAQCPAALDAEFICKGYDSLQRYGFNRALYTVRTMELFLPTGVDKRLSYFEGILNAGVVDIAASAVCTEENQPPYVAVYGSEDSVFVLRTLFSRYFPQIPFLGVPNKQLAYATRGFLCVRGDGTTK